MSFSIKDLIIEYRLEGLSYREIAEKTHTSEEYCRTIWSRANRQSEVKPKVKKDGTCKYCGKQLVMTPGAKPRQFCSDGCRYNYHNQQKQRQLYVRICDHCGKEFVALGNPKKRFCCRDCLTAATRKGGEQYG